MVESYSLLINGEMGYVNTLRTGYKHVLVIPVLLSPIHEYLVSKPFSILCSGCNNKAPQCVCLKQQKFIVSLLEAGTSRPWSWFLLKTVRDHLFRAPAFGDLRAICANLYSLPHPVLCHHLYLAFSPCLCVSATKFPLLIRIPVFPD